MTSPTNHAAQGTQRALEFERLIQDTPIRSAEQSAATPAQYAAHVSAYNHELDPNKVTTVARKIWLDHYAAEQVYAAQKLRRRVLGAALIIGCVVAWVVIYKWLELGGNFH